MASRRKVPGARGVALALAGATIACGASPSGGGGLPDGAAGVGAAGGAGATGGASGSGGASASGGAGGVATGGASGGGGASASGGSSGSAGAAGGGGSSGSAGGAGTGATSCDPLPPPTGTVVRLGPADAGRLVSAAYEAVAETTILLEDGTYRLSAGLQLRRPGVQLRSASGNPEAVVLDGDDSVAELIAISASDVTVAELTLTRAVDHLVHVYTVQSNEDVRRVLLHRVRLVDAGEQFVKVNPAAVEAWVDAGVIQCSTFLMTARGRSRVERNPGGCYTGGIDVHAGRGWVVRRNHFEGIYCAGEGLAEHAIHFWRGSRDTLIEHNVIRDCARGIGLGLEGGRGSRRYSDQPHGGADLAHYDGVVRGNAIWADIPWFDTGIELHDTREPRVHHNTIVITSGATGFFSGIDWRFPATRVLVRNNLAWRLTERNGAGATLDANVPASPGTAGLDLGWFVDAAGGDLHLTAAATGAIDRGVVVEGAGLDLDGEDRDHGAAPDIGADERR